MLFVLTGKSQTGKTSLLKKLIEEPLCIKQFCGVISPAVFEPDDSGVLIKTGIDAWLLPSFEKFHLASKVDSQLNLGGKCWNFDDVSIARINAHLNNISTLDNLSNKCLVIDEIGPLELHENAGFYAGFSLLKNATLFSNAIVVVRPSLVEEFLDRFGLYWQNEIKIFEPSDTFSFEF